ncbi:SDR family NAD(P)-dependent oxidoreductase [Microtetraspora malaysiensis]|uniref:SDR family NAD(P)-dependent oxidoreductase n=1 Tax=Microtetraspora malaysiensis TaxID=161358 RepID=UPI003D8BDC52
MLMNKNAVIYGATGAVGGAVAETFAREGARVFLTGRDLDRLEVLADKIVGAGGQAEFARVDALDRTMVADHLAEVRRTAGRIDISFNATGISHRGLQGIPLVDLPEQDFSRPIDFYTKAQFTTATAAARHMTEQGSGVIMTLSATPARLAAPLVGGMAPAWAAIEAFSRVLAAELGPAGVRVVCLRSNSIPETPLIAEVFSMIAPTVGLTPEQFQAGGEQATMLKRLPTLAEVADVAAFMASDRAGAMTGVVANLSAGSVPD